MDDVGWSKRYEALRKLPKEIQTPWHFETDRPVTEPPDINYRTKLMEDQHHIDSLLKDQNRYHFTVKYERYELLDLRLELSLLRQYREWNEKMLDDAAQTSNFSRGDFFQGLYAEVNEDYQTLKVETDTLSHKIRGRESRERGQTDFSFGVPWCDCAACRQKAATQHEELKRRAAAESSKDFRKSGVPNCGCRLCKTRRRQRKMHKKLKRKAHREGQKDFELGVDGCHCTPCILIQFNARRKRHWKLKRDELNRGNRNFSGGVPSCVCNSCREGIATDSELDDEGDAV